MAPNYFPIRFDAEEKDYDAPQWKVADAEPKGEARQWPLLYRRSTSGKDSFIHIVEAQWKTGAGFRVNPGRKLWVSAEGTDGMNVDPAVEADYDRVKGTITIKDVTLSKKLSDKTKFYEGTKDKGFKLEWKITCCAGKKDKKWTTAGESINILYTCLADPIGTRFRTVVNWACRPDGAGDEKAAFDCAWSSFSKDNKPANANNWEGQTLYYYQLGESAVGKSNLKFNLPDLLKAAHADKTGNGNCEAWADGLGRSAKIHGVKTRRFWVLPTSRLQSAGFLVKSWEYGAPHPRAQGAYKWLLGLTLKVVNAATGEAGFTMVPIPAGGKYWDLTSKPGLAGQNTETPAEKQFNLHVIVKYESLYYDPSYGKTYTDEANFEKLALDGYTAVDLREGEVPPKPPVMLVKPVSGNTEIRFDPFDEE